MATRIENIILRARDTLADPSAERWSDARLLRLLSEAQEDINIHHELLKTTVKLPLIVGKFIYDLPSDCYRILRASTEDYEIPLVSYTSLDEQARREIYSEDILDYWQRDRGYSPRTDFDNRQVAWEAAEGNTIRALVFDNRNPLEARLYPIPNEDIAQAEYTFENAGPILFAGDEFYGVVTAIEATTASDKDYTFDSIYGVVTDLYDPFVDTEIFESVYGVVTQINETEGFVTVYYSQNAPVVEAATDTLVIPPMYDKAMKYYIIAHAYDDDFDTRNQEKSVKALGLYQRELQLAEKYNETDGTRAPQFRSHYRSPFE